MGAAILAGARQIYTKISHIANDQMILKIKGKTARQ